MARRPTVVPFPTRFPFRLTARGAPIPDIANVSIALNHEPAFAVAFAFDEMQQQAILRAAPPLPPNADAGEVFPRFVTEEDITALQRWMQTHLSKIGREHIHWALEEFARLNPIHPLRDWLQTRPDAMADGRPIRARIIDRWLSEALGVPNDAYHGEIGRRFIIAMVARIMEPGCQCDYMLVLEGPQGKLKSQFCRALAGPEYFSDHIPALNSDQVRVSMHMRGKWLIEISELAAFNKVADVETLKAFITRREEIFTPKYGRKERREPRQCLFIGTTNTDDWIRDETGARRFWPVKVGQIDLDWLEEHRDQLFAEALQAYEAGEPWWPDEIFERRVIAPHQERRQFHDNWTDRVLEAAATLSVVTIALIWTNLGSVTLGADITKLDMISQKRIAAILKRGGYAKTHDSTGRIVWRKPEKTDPTDRL